MAISNSFVSVIVFFLILTVFTGEAHDANSPVVGNAEQNDPSDCAKEYITASMEDIDAKCKDFVKNEIVRRLQISSFIGKDRNCLVSCYGGYQAAIASLTRGVADVSTGHYSVATNDVVAFTSAITPCMKCSAKLTPKDPQFLEFQKWAKYVVNDLHNKLKTCSHQ